jgi:hypothetical protein
MGLKLLHFHTPKPGVWVCQLAWTRPHTDGPALRVPVQTRRHPDTRKGFLHGHGARNIRDE